MGPNQVLKSNTDSNPIIPGKYGDDGQLGITMYLPEKKFQAPKPPKKRYLEENYSQNKSVVEEEVVVRGSVAAPRGTNENSVPGIVGSGEERSRVAARRRPSARACKGQKYREFMWTNVMHQRRSTSRWELCQDAVEQVGEDVHHPSRAESFPASMNSAPSMTDNGSATIITPSNKSDRVKNGELGVEQYFKKKRVSSRIGKKLEENSLDDDMTSTSLNSSDCPVPSPNSSTSSEQEKVGSKKRKARRQSIRRLEPGSSFKDTSVVSESSLSSLTDISTNKVKKSDFSYC